MQAFETKEDSVVRCFKRETGVSVPHDLFTCVALCDHRFKDRQQEPQTIGCHTISYVFTLSIENIDSNLIFLDKNEYESGETLKPFSREDLVRENVFPSILDVYDTLFT